MFRNDRGCMRRKTRCGRFLLPESAMEAPKMPETNGNMTGGTQETSGILCSRKSETVFEKYPLGVLDIYPLGVYSHARKERRNRHGREHVSAPEEGA